MLVVRGKHACLAEYQFNLAFSRLCRYQPAMFDGFTTEFPISLSAPRNFSGAPIKTTIYLYIFLNYNNDFNRFLLYSKIRIIE